MQVRIEAACRSDSDGAKLMHKKRLDTYHVSAMTIESDGRQNYVSL